MPGPMARPQLREAGMPRRVKEKAVESVGMVTGPCGAPKLLPGALPASRLRISTDKWLWEGGGESHEDWAGLLKKARSSSSFKVLRFIGLGELL